MSTQAALSKPFFCFTSEETPDWGFARNKKAVLMVSSAEWVQSVFSCQIIHNGKILIAPNRDSSYEGLLVYNNGENWKFFDFIGLSVQNQNGVYLPIFTKKESPSVYLSPWKMSYCYYVSSKLIDLPYEEDIPFYVNYNLNSHSSGNVTTGSVEVCFPRGLEFGNLVLKPSLHPYFDIRHMYRESSYKTYISFLEHHEDHEKMVLSHYDRTISLTYNNLDCDYFTKPDFLEWRYKLGSGERAEKFDNNKGKNVILFKPEKRTVASYFSISPNIKDLSRNSFKVHFACGLNDEPKKTCISDHITFCTKSYENDFDQLKKLNSFCVNIKGKDIREAVIARIAGLLKFKIHIEDRKNNSTIESPYAGAWWFKTPWYRDIFEGYLNSYSVFSKFSDEKSEMKKTILYALSKQDPLSGLIPNRIIEFQEGQQASYGSTDAVLLCYILAGKIILSDRDIEFAKKILKHITRTIEAFSSYTYMDSLTENGTPHTDASTGLLLSVPQHSWIDTQNNYLTIKGKHFTGLPCRLSEKFFSAIYDHIGEGLDFNQFMSSSNFYLPEINAQWITVLRLTSEMLQMVRKNSPMDCPPVKFDEDIRKILDNARSNFCKVFYNVDNGYLYNAVYMHSLKKNRINDETESETAVVAAAMLGEMIFSKNELNSILKRAREKLMVYRTLEYLGHERLPFGIMAQNINKGPYLNDSQYHADVCWPRSTPYLIQLLDYLDDRETIGQILLNNLDHQSTESAIFYNQELFSGTVPQSANPCPQYATERNPVPVKNPIQFWSQWCDPYLQYDNYYSSRSQAT